MTEFEELTEIIATTRHHKEPDHFVYAETIAEAIQKAGFFKVENQIMVTEGMLKSALLAHYPSTFEIREIEEAYPMARSNMTHALYAAFSVWKGAKK